MRWITASIAGEVDALPYTERGLLGDDFCRERRRRGRRPTAPGVRNIEGDIVPAGVLGYVSAEHTAHGVLKVGGDLCGGVAPSLVIGATGVSANDAVVAVRVRGACRRGEEYAGYSGGYAADRSLLVAQPTVVVLGIESGVHYLRDISCKRSGDVNRATFIGDDANFEVGNVNVAIDVKDAPVVVRNHNNVAIRIAHLCREGKRKGE